MAIETARSGGIGILDAAHVPPERLPAVAANLDALVRLGASTSAPRIGLRLTAAQAGSERAWIDALSSHPHWIILCAWAPGDLASLLPALQSPNRQVWLEAGDGAALESVDAALPFTGWAGCGAECGGLSGSESAFVLAQRLAAAGKPFTVRGGIGLASAAACAVAGAHAVILDDSLLLLRESPLPARWQHLIGRLSLTDTARIGAERGLAVRVIDRPECAAGRRLKTAATHHTDQADRDRIAWHREVATSVGWGDPDRLAWPIGETAGRAAEYAARFHSVRALIASVQHAIDTYPAIANARRPLAEHSPLAEALRIRVPIVQGPMTRVSDSERFAAAVADAGGLPLLALALMTGADVAPLLASTAGALRDRPWGVGILGFAPDDVRLAQLAAVRSARPPCALIAGGRPEQAAQLEADGIATFVHVPAVLIAAYLEQGVRRLVFEGGECGGHTGPLHSFALWDYAITQLTDRRSPSGAPLQVLFAGGIHDGLSAAMVAAAAAPLVDTGTAIGVLLGTAYLFTREAVASAAITDTFQHEAIDSAATVTIETGPGHVIRCAPTPFVDAFNAEKQALIGRGVSGEALGKALDQLIMGRLRIASKGRARRGDRLETVDAASQRHDGLFMLGQVAALHDRAGSIAELHHEVAEGGTERLRNFAAPVAAHVESNPSDVAIVGMSCLVPGAADPNSFWRNVLDQRPAITEIPRERWDHRLFYDPRPGARDRIASKWGGFVDAIGFDPIRFGVPPHSLKSITPPQLLALELSRRALVDAGYADARPPDGLRARTATVFAVGNTADLEQMYMTRAALPLIVGPVDESVLRRLPEWTEESYPGLLANVTAGRVANRFDLRGPNLSVDAACASSLAALDIAVREVADGRSDLALCGGFDFEMSPQAYMGFSHTRALSPRGRADVFDRDADGIVIAEGGVVLVLKRLADAERDGDRIYSVIKAVAASSDGRGLSMTAPKSTGQEVALDRAYARAGVDPSSIALYEAHGTGTALGDAAEAATVTRVLSRAGAGAGSCAVGSVKSLIGHTRIAAGLVAVMKASLALHHRVRPAHASVQRPLAELSGETPLALLKDATPWLENDAPRRAGASAFGFGGTNYHAVLEEHRRDFADAPSGAADWPAELFVVSAKDEAALQRALARLDRAAGWLASLPSTSPQRVAMRDLAFVCAVEAANGGSHRAAIIAKNLDGLRSGIASAVAGRTSPAVHLGHGDATGELGFLFPGQGSQYPGMARALALYLPEIQQAMRDAAQVLPGQSLSQLVWPAAAFDDSQMRAQEQRLADTAVAQPAIAAISCGLLDVVRRLGWRAHAVAGHSFGEFVALHAAGAMDRPALLALAAARGRAMANASPGSMAMLAVDAAVAAQLIADVDGVVIANRNAPSQTVVSGSREAIAAVIDRATAAGHRAVALPVSGAFHSPLMASAREPLDAAIRGIKLSAPATEVFANAGGAAYSSDPGKIAEQLHAHLESAVDFVAQIESMYAAGVRTFVEVGPGKVLTGLVRRILGDRPFAARPLDGDWAGLLESIGATFVDGHATSVAALYDGRNCHWLDFDRLPAREPEPEWFVDGARVWQAGAAVHSSGLDPFLTADSPITSTLPLLPIADLPLPPIGAGTPLVEFYREYEQTMRDFLQQQERMLGHVLGLPVAGAPPPVPVAATVAPVVTIESPRALPARSDRAGLLEQLITVVCDRTGYAPDAVGANLDLEAELGIDSIKRIDIIATFVSSLAEHDRQRLQRDLDRLTRLRTLNAIADSCAQAIGTGAGLPAQSRPHRAADARFVMTVEPAPFGSTAPRALSGLHLVTRDAMGVADLVAGALRERGATVEVLDANVLASADRVSERLAAARASAGPVRGVIHLAALGRPAVNASSGWRSEIDATTISLFRVLKSALVDPADGHAVILAATALGGRWGRDAHRAGAELASGVHGMLRSLAREYPDTTTLVVDVDERDAADAIGQSIVREFLAPAEPEIGYRGGQRFRASVAAIAAATTQSHDGRPEAGWVVLATGGTRGIVAQVCEELASPGVRFILVGRGGSPSGDHARTLQALAAKGALVETVHVDVGDETAFARVIDEVYRRHGRIDAVLHGAGVIDDQRMERKTEASFMPIFGAKVGGAWTLAHHLRPEGLRWVLLFGSVSGRFGNPGQVDYAAANEVLNRIAHRLSREWPDTRVATINWGPWRGVGMMSPSTLALVQARGIEPMDPQTGRTFVIDELRGGSGVEVIAGDGPWAPHASATRERR